MFWTEEKLVLRVNELSEFRYRDAMQIHDFKLQLDEQGENGVRPPELGEWSSFRKGDYWSGRDRYVWLMQEVDIPQEWEGKTVVGRFDFGRTGGGNNSGFESMLFVEGEPFQGVDSNHQEVFFNGELAGRQVSLSFRLWSGLEGGGRPTAQEHTFRRAEIAWLDEATDDLYFTGKAAVETVSVLPKGCPERIALLKALEHTFLQIDWSQPESDNFYSSIRKARNILRNELKELKRDNGITVHCIGHTHIDVAWLWRLRHTREKAARSFSTVLRLMEKYPEYIFLQTQPQLYDFVKTDYPEIFEQIRKRVSEKCWEADGAMWLEADCNLTSGESLVRQILSGTGFLRREFGVECKYLWLPDVFGYSWALPQILKKSGIHTFMTTKISWNQYNRMPHDTFVWRGMDGSEVLAHFITTPEVANPSRWWYTYNGQITPQTVQGIWDAYQDKSINQDLLLSYGFGDGGGGVNREMLEMRRRLEDMPGLPTVVTGRVDEFFAALHKQVEETDAYVHTWDGELYLEYHRGTYTSQAYNKRQNRKLELLYRETEWLGVFGSLLSGEWSIYPQTELNHGWKIILRNQFHDIIPGSSIREVYEDSRKEYDEARRVANMAGENAKTRIVQNPVGNQYVLLNSSPTVRNDVVKISGCKGMESGTWFDVRGEELISQRYGNDWYIFAVRIPSMGYTTIEFRNEKKTPHQTPFQFHSNGVATPHYKVEWNNKGQITRLYDLDNEREILLEGERGNVFQVFEDKPKMFDAWDIDLFYQQKMREVSDLVAVDVTDTGAIRVVVTFKWAYMNSTIEQNMILYSQGRRIGFETRVDWHERQQLLKVAFPVDVRATEATYDIQFGNVKRPTHWNTSWDYARFETVGHQWVDLSETGYGVSLLNDCKYGHDIKDSTIRLSLIKSAVYPDVEADQGEHVFTYALLPHAGDWMDGETVREAFELNNPISVKEGEAACPARSLFSTSAKNIMIDAVKKAENSNQVVLRVHEFSGARGQVSIESDFEISSWQECDLLERVIDEPHFGKEICFNLKPYEIKTFLLEFAATFKCEKN